ncbi:polysaccharide biosynthesis C-terminal domain-containing protein [Agriterribacter sp.]|uniref:polysaccharide biosynthesis C-terminal domain-containing protein n=1 Tax=Agriterribacter sp. TaxID=2821509 RepID=UPI002C8D01CC|nr:polysaccharide biosynthesis C-terminal domain-containing protein [Agriterribacter sp.]HRP57425.1 polysaccharide biosynthesis C-terminal domain-containing protein [Agriterribacter sp.]
MLPPALIINKYVQEPGFVFILQDYLYRMSMIRRQSIISSIVIYMGFAVGMLNVYFFTREGLFTPSEYGLTGIFIAIGSMMQAFASLAMPSYIFKFHPYYSHHLSARKNDMVTWALLIGCIGFLLVMLAGWIFKDLVIRKFGENSPDLVKYYYWIFPMGFGLMIYTILESYTWSIHKPVVTNFLKEVLWRLFTTLLIVLFIFHVVGAFDVFIKLYAFTYPGIALTLFIYLVATKQIHFTFKLSKVTRRYFKKIVSLCLFAYSGMIVFTLSGVFDSLVIAAVLDDGLSKAGIFGLAQIMTSVIQAPQRGIIAASIAHLSRAWKDKNMELLQRVYQRSSINLLLFAAGIFVLIALNYTEAIHTLGLKDVYLAGFSSFILLGLSRVIDLGTGLNAQIIATSNYWRFELVSGIVLLVFMLPLTYFLTKQYGIRGPAMANLISQGIIYNLIRIVFLWKKFKLQPFTPASIYTVVMAGCCYAICYFGFKTIHGFTGLFLRSAVFVLLYGGCVIYFKLSPDMQPVWQSIRKRIRI